MVWPHGENISHREPACAHAISIGFSPGPKVYFQALLRTRPHNKHVVPVSTDLR